VRLLLDTHVVLWLASEPERTGDAQEVLGDEAHALVLSAASVWELASKTATGRLCLPDPVEQWVAGAVRRLALEHLDVTWQDAAAVSALPPHHRDPFDRLLVAQARRHGLVLVTADRALAAYDVEQLRIP
jgi:PIN domain nuclease of toxin-antitoxin system